jgi:peptide/nickel transport system substrate-binding protein
VKADTGKRVAHLSNVTVTRRGLLQRGLALGIALPAVAGLLAACGGSSDKATVTKASGAGASSSTTSSTASPTSAALGQPVLGGKLSMSLADADVVTFDPIASSDNMSIWTDLLIYDQLMRVSADGTALEPGLAEKWEASTDGLTYTFNLRSVNFHDGTPVTAADVAYCLNRGATDEASGWSWIYLPVDNVSAQDDHTAVAKLKQVYAPYISLLALSAGSVYPKALHEAKKDDLWQHPIGSGPFVFDSWEKDSRVVLKKNPSYWTTGKPYLDELDFFVLTDANTRMLQFQSGDLDIATDAPFSQLEALKANPEVQLLTDSVARMDFMGINAKRFPDVKVRQAMNYAVDKDAIIKNVLFGAGTMQTTCLPKMPGWNAKVVGYPFDLDKAKQLMAESSMKDGFSATFQITTGDPVQAQVAQLVADNLSKINGKLTITQIDPGTYFDNVRKGDFDIYKSYSTTDVIDASELLGFYGAGDFGTTGYSDPALDALLAQANSEPDATKRQALYDEVQQKTTDAAPYVFLYYPSGRTAVHKHVKNFRILPTGNYRLWETWVEK